MSECYVRFTSAHDVMEFVSIATKQYFPIQVEYGDLKTSATSIMSIFSIGFHCPVRVVLPAAGEHAEAFFSQVQPYLVA